MKKSLTVRIDSQILERIRDIVYWHPEFTITGFVESTMKEVVKQFADCKERPVKKLKSGRKIKT